MHPPFFLSFHVIYQLKLIPGTYLLHRQPNDFLTDGLDYHLLLKTAAAYQMKLAVL